MDNQDATRPTDYGAIVQRLENILGSPAVLHQVSPLAHCQTGLDVLLATILTQATNDRNASRAWDQLKLDFPTPVQLWQAPPAAVADAIRPAGLANQKAAAIHRVLEAIHDQLGELSLAKLAKNPQGAFAFLNGLPGVGPKTAACTLLFGLGLPAFPIDTHIDRIIKRLGWVDPKTPPAKAQEILGALIPSSIQANLHILLLNLGRVYCRPTRPHCAATPHPCPLQKECPAYGKFFSDAEPQ